MSDPHDPTNDPTHDGRAADDAALSPEQEAALRRLLRGARHTEPTPEAVATRLDDVIAGLARERAAGTSAVTDLPPRAVPPLPGTTTGPTAGPPAPLDLDAARRRRGRRTNLLLAAAAVVVAVGVGGVVLPQVTGSGQDDAATSDQSAETSEEQQEDGAGAAEAPPQAAPTPDDVAPQDSDLERQVTRLAQLAPPVGTILVADGGDGLASDRVADDVVAVLTKAGPATDRDLPTSACGGLREGEGGVLTSYDDAAALLGVRVETTGDGVPSRVALSVRLCSSGEEVWSAVAGAR